MHKFLIILIVYLIQLSLAAPSYLPPTPVVEYEPTVVGHTVHHIPTAISHQSQTIVHERRPYLRPIIEQVPIVRYAPIATTIETVPHVETIETAPIIKTHHVPITTTIETTPIWHSTYGSSLSLPTSYSSSSPWIGSGLYDGWRPRARVYGGYGGGYGGGWNNAWNGWNLKK